MALAGSARRTRKGGAQALWSYVPQVAMAAVVLVAAIVGQLAEA